MDNERNDEQREVQYNPMPNVKKSKKPLSVPPWATIICVLIAVIVTFQTTYCLLNDNYNTEIKKFKSQMSKANSELGSMYNIMDEIAEIYDKNYIYDVDYKDLKDKVLLDYVLEMGDRYGYYHTKEEWEEDENTSNGNSVGVGIRINPVYSGNSGGGLRGLLIVYVMSNTPASKAGFEQGDVIIELDGKSLEGMTYSEALNLSLGEKGTTLNAKVERNGSIISVSVVRDTYETETVISSTIEKGGKKIGLVKITEFYQITATQFINAVNDLLDSGCDSIIFDVRNNPGGELDSILKILDFILPEGPVVHIKEASGVKITYRSGKDCICDVDMVVLANSDTASAAELFTSALKDYDYAKIIGTTTYGKGCGQNLVRLNNGAVLRVTAFLYYPPYSDNFDGVGVIPDIEVDLEGDAKKTNLYLLKYEDDAQLQAAVEYLISK